MKVLMRKTPSVVHGVVQNASPEVLRTLRECCHNVLKGHVPLSPAQKTRLRKYKKGLRALTRRRISELQQKKILQTGGFLPALLRPILGVLGSVLGL